MNDGPMRWYDSKVDVWLAAILVLPPAAMLTMLVMGMMAGNFQTTAVGLVGAVFITAMYFGLIFPMRYGINDQHLVVRSGLIRRAIRLQDITHVVPTHNPLSSPALSLDRLWIQFGEGLFQSTMISPAERQTFLEQLTRQAGLVLDPQTKTWKRALLDALR